MRRLADLLLRGLVTLVGYLVDEAATARLRVRCIRHGHALLTIVNGWVCTRCGLFWEG